MDASRSENWARASRLLAVPAPYQHIHDQIPRTKSHPTKQLKFVLDRYETKSRFTMSLAFLHSFADALVVLDFPPSQLYLSVYHVFSSFTYSRCGLHVNHSERCQFPPHMIPCSLPDSYDFYTPIDTFHALSHCTWFVPNASTLT